MKEKKDSIFMYLFLGAGYLLFCSIVPSVLAAGLSMKTGGDSNLLYAGLLFITGTIYVIIVFQMMKEKMELLKGFSGKGILWALITAIVLFFVINFVVSPFLSVLFPVSAENYDGTVSEMMKTPLATFLQVTIVAPLFEELIFRGLILKRSLRQRSKIAAVLLTAILFGVLHMSILQGISAAAAGIVLCMFYVKQRSVGLNILAHSIYNGMVFFLAAGVSV